MSPTSSAESASESSWSTSVSLLERVRANDARSWRQLADLYGPLVFRWCDQAGLASADAADVGQEVFQSVFRAIERFDRRGQTGAFRSWLKTITRRKVIDLHRQRRSQPVLLDEGIEIATTDPDSDSETGLETALLYRRALDLIRVDFTEATWRAFFEVVVEERPVREVAMELGITPNAVYIARSRVLSRLRAEFAGLIE